VQSGIYSGKFFDTSRRPSAATARILDWETIVRLYDADGYPLPDSMFLVTWGELALIGGVGLWVGLSLGRLMVSKRWNNWGEYVSIFLALSCLGWWIWLRFFYFVPGS